MRILFIAPRFHSNQIYLIQKLIKERNSVEFFVIGKGISESYKDIIPKQIPVSKITKLITKPDIDFARYANKAIPKIFGFMKMIAAFKPDVIILRGASSPIYSKIVIPYALVKGFKIIFYTQGPKYVSNISWLRKIHDWFFIRFLKFKWITPVLYKGKNMIGLQNLSYIDFIPFFMPLQVEKLDENMKDLSKIRFLCVAKFEPRKNIKLLIEVIRDVSINHTNIELTIVGSTGTEAREDYYKQMKKICSEHNVSNINIIKNVNYPDMRNYYLNNHILILPSTKEPASVSQIEAMAYGLAIICSLDNGTAHYVENNFNGFVCKADYFNLTNTILYYIKNPNKIIEHGQKSLELIENKFSITESYAKLIDLLQK